MAAFKELVFSGVQPTGNLHLGNYLGAIRRFVEMQAREAQCLYCVVDMHAITVWQDPEALRGQIREVTAAFLAAGIDPKRSIVFNQSQVPQHAELAWVFNCVARLGWLNRMTQFKEKAGKDRENASIGLYDYPVLMAADILAYRATHVPVGEDQKQHLELTRDIAQKFNTDFGASITAQGHGEGFFPITEPIIGGPAARVMSCATAPRRCRSPTPRTIRASTSRTIRTPSPRRSAGRRPIPRPCPPRCGLKERPEADNLVGIYAALAGTTREDVLREHGGAQFSAFKPALADLAVSSLAPIAAEMRRLSADPGHIEAVLADGAERAEAIAQQTLDAVKDIVGFVRRKRG